ncbi:MAG: hypothetical protein E7441_12220 [Ruminococcaceae bacterium]|nr:hypothetical protein [Oscillospiraceae bacterium]
MEIMKLIEYQGKKVRIIAVNNKEFIGVAEDYVYPEDNESEGESIIINTLSGALVEIRPEEIKEIEIV